MVDQGTQETGSEQGGMPTAPKKMSWGEGIGLAFAFMLAIAFYAGLGYLIYLYWNSFATFVVETVTSPQLSIKEAAPIFAIMAIFGAFALYFLRLVARLHYGMVEIMFGVLCVVAAAHTASIEGQVTSLIQVAGGVFFMIRGIDNVKIGLDERPNHRVWDLWNLLYSEEKLKKAKKFLEDMFAWDKQEGRPDRTDPKKNI